MTTRAVITKTKCQNHDGLYYSYTVGGHNYTSGGTGGCNHKPGETEIVYYDSEAPEISFDQEPDGLWLNEIAFLVSPSFALSLVLTLALRARLRHW